MSVRNQLAEDIKSGNLLANDSLPSERMLSERFNVSRMTARQALIQLEKEGLAHTNGKRGRFVSDPKVNYDVSKSVSFFADACLSKDYVQISVLSFETKKGSDEQCKTLNLKPGSDIHFYSRLCHLGDRTAFFEEEYVPAERFPNLREHDIAQSVSLLLENEYGVHSVRSQIVIKLCHFSSPVAKALGLEGPAIGLLHEQTVLDENDHPVSFGLQYWRGDVARFSADIKY